MHKYYKYKFKIKFIILYIIITYLHQYPYLFIVNLSIAHLNLGVTGCCLCYILMYLVFTLTYFRAMKHMLHLVEP